MTNAQGAELWWQMVEEGIKRLREVGMQEWTYCIWPVPWEGPEDTRHTKA